MATTRFILLPYAAEFPAANFPELLLVNRRPALAFDAVTNETCQWTVLAPTGWDTSPAPIAKIYYIMASAVAGNVDCDVDVEAITDGDAFDLDAGDSFDAVNSTDNVTVPGTAGYMDVVTVTLTNNDGSVASDYLRFRFTRDAAQDTAAGDMYVLAIKIEDSA